jgi:putative transposase
LHPLDTVISVIASDRKAKRVGTALLVVDGTDQVLKRKAEISLVPGRVRARSLSKLVSLSREVYNATVQHRRDAWRLAQVTVTRFDEFNEISGLRALRPDVAVFGNQFVRGSISRADEAFAAFFRRLGDGESPGYPRFKSHRRFRTAFYDEPVGWVLRRLEGDDPALYVQGWARYPCRLEHPASCSGSPDGMGNPARSPSKRPARGPGGPVSGSGTWLRNPSR